MLARREVYLEEYSKTLNIEVKTMLSMLHRQIIPACLTYAKDLGTIVSQKKPRQSMRRRKKSSLTGHRFNRRPA